MSCFTSSHHVTVDVCCSRESFDCRTTSRCCYYLFFYSGEPFFGLPLSSHSPTFLCFCFSHFLSGSGFALQLPVHFIHLVFLAGLTYTAIVRLPCQAIFKDFPVLELSPSFAQASTEGPLCLLPNSPVSLQSRDRLGARKSQWTKW